MSTLNIQKTCCMFSATVLFGFVVSAQAASFDCGKAGSKVEHIICDNSEISNLDDELAQSYKVALQDQTKAEQIREEQKRWMKERNDCASVDCVKQTYGKRLSALKIDSANPNASSVSTKRFVVTKGEGYTVCESYATYLNSLPESEPLPLCHLKRAPDFPDLKDLDWEEMEISSNLQLVYILEKKLSPSMHNRPVDTFDHWKDVYEQQINSGEALPRLRRTHLALLPDSPVETILAYEPDGDSCDKEMQKNGYAYVGTRTKLFVWDEQEQRIAGYGKQLAFGIPHELMLFHGKPLLFFPYWGGAPYSRLTRGRLKGDRVTGGIEVFHFVSAGVDNQYGSVPRCTINFELPSAITKRMIK